jgi:tight adherence protein B
MIIAFVLLAVMAAGGAAFAFMGGDERSQKRVAAVARPVAQLRGAGREQAEAVQKRAKNIAAQLKDIEQNKARKKEKPTMRRRLEQAGFPNATARGYWILCGILAVAAAAGCYISHQTPLVIAMATFAAGFGLPRWALSFLTNRRRKKFTNEFANAIDVIVRSVKSGLPTNEALRIVAKESPDPVGAEFRRLVEGSKVGVTLDQGLKRMFDSMPTPEVGFFSIVMTIQSRSGGNLSEALGNLSAVLRDRKRLEGKIRAMSSEAKASSMIIGSLPPGVMLLVYLTTPAYIALLFTEKMGNLMLLGCAVWMSIGIFVMRKMINFKT